MSKNNVRIMPSTILSSLFAMIFRLGSPEKAERMLSRVEDSAPNAVAATVASFTTEMRLSTHASFVASLSLGEVTEIRNVAGQQLYTGKECTKHLEGVGVIFISNLNNKWVRKNGKMTFVVNADCIFKYDDVVNVKGNTLIVR